MHSRSSVFKLLVDRLLARQRRSGPKQPGPVSRRWLISLIFTGLVVPAEAQVSDDVVKIGVLNDQSAGYADLGGVGSIEAAKMAVEDFGRTVLGRPVEVVSADHQQKADIGASIARGWFDSEKVD